MGQYNTQPDLLSIIADLKTRVTALENSGDTGWQALILGSGITGFGFTPSARRIGNIVFLKGGIIGAWSSGQTLATLPPNMAPMTNVAPSMNVWTGTNFIGQDLNIETSGKISVLTAQTLGSFNLDGVTFPVN